MIHFILGGQRSGKSRYAQERAEALADAPVYLATSRRWDADHEARIARHQAGRGAHWTTLEEEKHLSQLDLDGRVVVVDCVTLWLTNFFLDLDFDAEATLEAARAEFDGLADRAEARGTTLLIVSNEIGMGGHAHAESGRKFADALGFLHQHIARRADRVTLMVAGLPMPVK